ncbi:MAG: hypothetical protein HY347_08830 [candidate division NC10 bacterium]|nr:hypothetical protein [candidate division NC10 bacterium]
MNLASPGDKIRVRPGTYNEAVIVDKFVRLHGAAGATIVGQNDGTGLIGCIWIKDIDDFATKSAWIDGFTLQDCTDYGIKITGSNYQPILDTIQITHNNFVNAGADGDDADLDSGRAAIFYRVGSDTDGSGNKVENGGATISNVFEISHNMFSVSSTLSAPYGIWTRWGTNFVIDQRGRVRHRVVAGREP